MLLCVLIGAYPVAGRELLPRNSDSCLNNLMIDPTNPNQNENRELFETTLVEQEAAGGNTKEKSCSTLAACPVCGGHLVSIRAKLQCSRCHTICETCCEGGPG